MAARLNEPTLQITRLHPPSAAALTSIHHLRRGPDDQDLMADPFRLLVGAGGLVHCKKRSPEPRYTETPNTSV